MSRNACWFTPTELLALDTFFLLWQVLALWLTNMQFDHFIITPPFSNAIWISWLIKFRSTRCSSNDKWVNCILVCPYPMFLTWYWKNYWVISSLEHFYIIIVKQIVFRVWGIVKYSSYSMWAWNACHVPLPTSTSFVRKSTTNCLFLKKPPQIIILQHMSW